MHSSNLKTRYESVTVTDFNFLQSTQKHMEGSNVAKSMGAAHFVSIGLITPVFNILKISVFSNSRALGPALYDANVRAEVLLMLIHCSVLRRSCDLHDHPTCIQTLSSVQWTCSEMCGAWGQSWRLLSNHAPFVRGLHVTALYDHLLASANLLHPCSVQCLPLLLVSSSFVQVLRYTSLDLYQ